MRYFFCVLVALMCWTNCVSGQIMHAPKGIRKAMEKSELSYIWKEESEKNLKIVPDLKQNSPFTVVEMGENGRVPVLRTLPAACEEWVKRGDQLHEAGNLALAIEAYRTAAVTCPDFSYPEMLQSQEWLYLEDTDSAISAGERAVAKNYYDYTAHWILAFACFNGGQTERAVREITLAKLLNIHLMGVHELLVPIYAESGKQYVDFSFEPVFRISKSSAGVTIYAPEKWVYFASVMALWKYEPDYRKSMMKERGGNIPASMLQYKEGILNLMIASSENPGLKYAKDSDFLAMARAVKAGYVHEFIFAEILLPNEPSLIYQQSPEMIEKLADYWMEVHR